MIVGGMGSMGSSFRERIPFYGHGKPPRADKLAEIDFVDELEATWGRRWGAQSSLGKLRMAVVSRPTEQEADPEFAEDLIHFALPWGLPDVEKQRKEHEELVKVLKDEGVEIDYMEYTPPVMGPYCKLRGMVFAGIFIVLTGGAIVGRWSVGAWRRGTAKFNTNELHKLGCPVLYTVHGTGVLETGAVGWLDSKHFMVSLGPAANMDGVNQVTPILRKAGVNEIHLAYVSGDPSMVGYSAFHLDMIFGMVDAWLALVCPTLLDYNTIAYLRKKKIDLIGVSLEETMKYVPCNVLALEPGKVIIPAGCDRVIHELQKRGIDVIEVDLSEFIKSGGAPHCLVGTLIRDPGPALTEQDNER